MAAPRESPFSSHHHDRNDDRGTRANNAPWSNSRQSRAVDAQPMGSYLGQTTSGARFAPDVTYLDQPLSYASVHPFRPSAVSSSRHHTTGFGIESTSPAIHSSLRRTGNTHYVFDKLEPVWIFLFYTLPRQLYLHFLFRLPAFYFTRVAHIFEEAEMTMSEIEQMANDHGTYQHFLGSGSGYYGDTQDPNSAPAKLTQLRVTWSAFIDSLLEEWKTLNIVSALLLSAILTMLQLTGIANDPVARHAALFSLICALMSLLYGCMYIIRFGSMKGARQAVEWVAEGKKKTLIWWNVWVLLAIPAVWLAWSIVLFVVCVMTFVWRTGSGNDPSLPLPSQVVFGLRIAISAVLSLGILYLVLILHTFSRYGGDMHKAWKSRIEALAGKRVERRPPPLGWSAHAPPSWYTGQRPYPENFQPYRVRAPAWHGTTSQVPPYEPSPWLPKDFDGNWRFQAGEQPQAGVYPVAPAPGPETGPARGGHRQEAAVRGAR